jgi:hypothetical protein
MRNFYIATTNYSKAIATIFAWMDVIMPKSKLKEKNQILIIKRLPFNIEDFIMNFTLNIFIYISISTNYIVGTSIVNDKSAFFLFYKILRP